MSSNSAVVGLVAVFFDLNAPGLGRGGLGIEETGFECGGFGGRLLRGGGSRRGCGKGTSG